eukprot:scaffold242157_cov25-Prasinocladus_malaysianus.AAC.1
MSLLMKCRPPADHLELFVLLLSVAAMQSVASARHSHNPKLKIAMIGDSITCGACASHHRKTDHYGLLKQWTSPSVKWERFCEGGNSVCHEAEIAIQKLGSMIEDAVAFAPDIVLMMFGTNDSKHFQWQGKCESLYARDY